ncbi:hypothetical protein MMG00_13845 [Ignatzschineria rhizosphaerae]|uniref:Type 1 fimbrial protein n=1 Tax=Ignatzschineria rhizosphaerae TaxID=2923279 RepID=A0ABY3X643_9GAMM|nr:hypothetical protein [Ignatzschineria rhizosphaerae]UNM96255.1 hypothetical protein MMG00_13845 [Ignatzschineria rhizosphaerae]
MKKVLLLSMILINAFAQAAQDQEKSSLSLEGKVTFFGEVVAETCAPDTYSVQKASLSTQLISAQYQDCYQYNNSQTGHLSNVKVTPLTPQVDTTEQKNYVFFKSEFL